MFLALGKYLVIIIFTPPDLRTHSSKFPLVLHPPIPHGSNAMGMALDRDCLHAAVGVFLVRHPQLMRTHDFVVADLFPCTEADKVLGLQQGIAQKARIRGHRYKLIAGYGFPQIVQEGAVINLALIESLMRE